MNERQSPSAPRAESLATIADRVAEWQATLERRKTRAALEQHKRDMQFKHTFYDKDGKVTDVCPWEIPKKA